MEEFQVSIDNAPSYLTAIGNYDPQTYLQWYQSPLLSEGDHTVTVDQIRGMALDYLLVTPGPKTPLIGKTVMVDDSYPDIRYSGSGWRSTVGVFKESERVRAQPFQNGTHQTSMAGDSLTFSYYGVCFSIDFWQVVNILVRVGLANIWHAFATEWWQRVALLHC